MVKENRYVTDCGFNTALLHGVDDKNPYGTTQVPIYQSSAFRHECAEDLEKIFTNKAMGFSIRELTIRRWKHLRRELLCWKVALEVWHVLPVWQLLAMHS